MKKRREDQEEEDDNDQEQGQSQKEEVVASRGARRTSIIGATATATATPSSCSLSSNQCSVRVAVRIRPLLPKEIASRTQNCLQYQNRTVQFINNQRSFTYDHVFPLQATQSDLYAEALQPLMESFLQGFNITVIAYGQTGSGKTYTMGNNSVITAQNLFAAHADATPSLDALEEHEGLIPRFLHDLFARIGKEQGKCQTSVSFLEIYGEDIHDLLDNNSSFAGTSLSTTTKTPFAPEKLQLREGKTGVWVQGLTEVPITNRREALEQMRLGCLHRITACTEMNERSSRSHAVYTVKLVRRLPQGPRFQESTGHSKSVLLDASTSSSDRDAGSTTICSKLTFVDLAGSERLKKTQAEGNHMKEGIQINVGLLALGNVINALGDDKRRGAVNVHVPYRSSKLTRLLQEALGGNSRTLFIACVSPAETNENETLNTLQYANRARNIQNKAIKNVDSRSAELLALKSFNSLLRRELVRVRFLNGSTNNKVDVTSLKESIDSKLRDPSVISYLKMLEELAKTYGLGETDSELDDALANVSLPQLDVEPLTTASTGHGMNGSMMDPCKDNSLEHSTTESLNSENSDHEEFEPGPDSMSIKELGLVVDLIDGVLEKDSLMGQLFALEKRFDSWLAQKDALLTRHKLKLGCLKDTAQKLASLLSDPLYSTENSFSPETKRKYDEMRKTIEMTHARGKELAQEIVKLQAERNQLVNDKENQMAKMQHEVEAIQTKIHRVREQRTSLRNSQIQSVASSSSCGVDESTVMNAVDVVVHSEQIKLQFGLKDLVSIGDRLDEDEKEILPLLDKVDEVVRLPESFSSLMGRSSPKSGLKESQEHMKKVFDGIKNEIQEYVDHEDIEVCLSREIRNRASLLQKIIHQSMSSQESLKAFLSNQEALNKCEASISMFSDALRSRTSMRSPNRLEEVLKSINSMEDARVLIQLLVQELFAMKRLELSDLLQNELQSQADRDNDTKAQAQAQLQEITELQKKHEEEITLLKQEYEKEVVGALQMAMIDTKITQVTDKQLVLLGQKCRESDEKLQTMEQKYQQLQQELASKQLEFQQLQTEQTELKATLDSYKEREEALQMMNKCEEIWQELGIDESDRKDKIKNINNILVKKCTEEIESLQTARETLLKRIQVTVNRIQLLGETLQMPDFSNCNVEHLVRREGSKVVTLLDQERDLAKQYGDLQQILLQRISMRRRALESIQSMLHDLEIDTDKQFAVLGVNEMDLSSVKTEVQDFLAFVGECTSGNDWDLEKMLTCRWIAGAQRATTWFTDARILFDETLLMALRKEKTNRIVQADELRTRIRSLVGEMALTRADLVGIFAQAVPCDGEETQQDWEELANCILQQGGRVDISRRGMQRLVFLRDCLQDVHDGRTNAISFMCATLEEAAHLLKTNASCASIANSFLSCDPPTGVGAAQDQCSSKAGVSGLQIEEVGCSKQALLTGSQRLKRLSEPIESNIRAILFSMNEDFNAFGIESDAQRISFFLETNDVGTDTSSSGTLASPISESNERTSASKPLDPKDVKRNERRKAALEKYLLASTSAPESELRKTQALQHAASSASFLSDLDPCFSELGACFSALYGTKQLESLQTSMEELDLISGTIECAQKRLFSLRKIMKLFNETREYQKKITEFEAEASKKDRLFGSSIRLLEEERFRKAAAKRYPLLIATLRKEVDKWLKREEAEFNLNILGPELKDLLLEMMNTHTELMHLDLGLVDASRMQAQSTPLAPPPAPSGAASSTTTGLPPTGVAGPIAARRLSRNALSMPPPVPIKPVTPRPRGSQTMAKKRLDFDKN